MPAQGKMLYAQGDHMGKDDLNPPKHSLKITCNTRSFALNWLGCLACYRKPSFPAVQASQREVEVTLQKRLDEVSDELRKTQSSYKSLLADAEKAKGQQQSIGGEYLGLAQGELCGRLEAFRARCLVGMAGVGQVDPGTSLAAWCRCEQDVALIHGPFLGCHSSASILCCPASLPVPPESIHSQGFFGQESCLDRAGLGVSRFVCSYLTVFLIPSSNRTAGQAAELRSRG